MKKLFLRLLFYGFCIAIVLEVLVRVFHLTKDYPVRFVDERGVERWVPNQEGYSVTGNRRQNFSKFNINSSGFNSFRDFDPTQESIEVALVGDSFIEGFHQDYRRSIGKKIERQLHDVAVYDIGYAGYDFADQLHLIYQYQSFFDLIDQVVINLKFEDDLTRPKYEVSKSRMKLESPLYRSLRQIKLLVYLQNIGAFTSATELTQKLLSFGQEKQLPQPIEDSNMIQKKNQKYLNNFKSLVDTYGFNKSRYVLLLDKSNTPTMFLDYLDKQNYAYIDFGEKINHSKAPTTLIYDKHWNNYGRSLVASLIADYISKTLCN
jgi:hypothetical protein